MAVGVASNVQLSPEYVLPPGLKERTEDEIIFKTSGSSTYKVPKIELTILQETDNSIYKNAQDRFQGSPQAKALLNNVHEMLGNHFDVRINGDEILITPYKDTVDGDRKMGYIRKSLGVKEGVISANNRACIAGRRKLSDAATIENGHYLKLPISELGKDKKDGFLGIGSNREEMEALEKAVSEYKKTLK